jgi:hypothetical protein
MLRHARIDRDGEPIQRQHPILSSQRRFLVDVPQRQIIQLDQFIVIRERGGLTCRMATLSAAPTALPTTAR